MLLAMTQTEKMSQPIDLTTLAPPRPRHPDWIRVRAPIGENYTRLLGLVRTLNLHTVCEEALCPNIGECWGAGTLTIMILGDVCTRACRFCAVTTGFPRGIVDAQEPARVATALADLNLQYVVITSVDRDDLPDQGAEIFAQTVRAIKARTPQTIVEVLTPDFSGRVDLMQQIVNAQPEVIAQNIETVRRLTHTVRDRRAGYDQTLNILRAVKELDPTRMTKSSLLLGFGETETEVIETMRDLRAAQVDLLAIGQYLRPTDKKRHYPLMEYIHPDRFKFLKDEGMKLGFRYIASGPLVRSSYKAWEAARLFPDSR
ncbi:MAG: lipoyl synthase [Chloroflexi bacterium]|nr:lipoyl synthase [Chloroflexota bacterium]